MIEEHQQDDLTMETWRLFSKTSKDLLDTELADLKECEQCLRHFLDSNSIDAVFIIKQAHGRGK